jgi:hypothetical protein
MKSELISPAMEQRSKAVKKDQQIQQLRTQHMHTLGIRKLQVLPK